MSIRMWQHIKCDRTDKDCPLILNTMLKPYTVLGDNSIIYHTHFLNGSVVKYKGQTLYAYRTQQKPHFLFTFVHLCKLKRNIAVGEHFTFKPQPPPYHEETLQLKTYRQQYRGFDYWRAEDPRLFVHNDELYMFYTTGWKIGYCKIDIEFNDNGDIEKCEFGKSIFPDPPEHIKFKGSDGRQKNWSPLSYKGELCVLYSFEPLTFIRLSDGFSWTVETDIFKDYKYGLIKGGTPLQKMDNGEYLTIYHSTLKLEPNLTVYVGGALVLDENLRPKRISRYPLIAPVIMKDEHSYLDTTFVVFPAGLMREGNRWHISCGINDHSTGLLLLTDEVLENNLTPR